MQVFLAWVNFFCYICSMVEQEMKREMGKWLMDVAKYMFTALLISTIFADMEQPVVIYCALLSAFVLLFWGWILYGKSFDNKKYKNRKWIPLLLQVPWPCLPQLLDCISFIMIHVTISSRWWRSDECQETVLQKINSCKKILHELIFSRNLTEQPESAWRAPWS